MLSLVLIQWFLLWHPWLIVQVNQLLKEEKYDPLLINTELEKKNKEEWEINEDPVLKEEKMKTGRKRIVNKIRKDVYMQRKKIHWTQRTKKGNL